MQLENKVYSLTLYFYGLIGIKKKSLFDEDLQDFVAMNHNMHLEILLSGCGDMYP